MSNFIDRRLNPRDKTIRNRQKFIARSRNTIRKEIRKVIGSGSIKDIDTTKTKIKVKGIAEPTFSYDRRTGNTKRVYPGNEEYITGDIIEKPTQGGSGGSGKNAGEGVGEDEFEFLLTQEEFTDFLFEELELPYLVKKKLKSMTQIQYNRAGFKSYGTPNQIDIVKSLKEAMGRRIGMRRSTDEEIEELEQKIKETAMLNDFLLSAELEEQLAQLKAKKASVPWIDPFDIRYRNYVPTPKPITQAVMFCIMDVSASMGEREKDIAKRFFMLLHIFLKKKYEKLDVVFIAHHNEAKEVDEETFFHGKETGGTLVSTALTLTNKIIEERYDLSAWNIYVAQCSDGDNVSYDTVIDEEMPTLLQRVQYMAYVEVANINNTFGMQTDLWKAYEPYHKKNHHMAMISILDPGEIWKVFAELFGKEKAR